MAFSEWHRVPDASWGDRIHTVEIDVPSADDLRCCGLPLSEDGYCQHKGRHPRQLTREMLDKAVLAVAADAYGSALVRSQVLAALKAVL